MAGGARAVHGWYKGGTKAIQGRVVQGWYHAAVHPLVLLRGIAQEPDTDDLQVGSCGSDISWLILPSYHRAVLSAKPGSSTLLFACYGDRERRWRQGGGGGNGRWRTRRRVKTTVLVLRVCRNVYACARVCGVAVWRR